jgi:hypothetical protein
MKIVKLIVVTEDGRTLEFSGGTGGLNVSSQTRKGDPNPRNLVVAQMSVPKTGEAKG